MRRLFLFAAVTFLSLPAFSQSVSFNAMNVVKISGGSQGYNAVKLIGDFNGDGRQDMLESSNNSGGTTFHLLISAGTGAYSPSTSYTLPNNTFANGYAVGDFNGDRKLDLAIAAGRNQPDEGYIVLYLGEGNGTFQSPITIPLTFIPVNIMAADVNHDEKMDLVLLSASGGVAPSSVVTYFGKGTGGFTAGPTSPFGSSSSLDGIGDFDGDGKVDLFTANCAPGCNFAVYYGDGAGHFGSPTLVSSSNVAAPSIADVDGDGKSDIITSSNIGGLNSPGQRFLSVFYGAADRTLTLEQVPTSRCTSGRPVAADFNGDHVPDIIFLENDCSSASTGSAEIAFLAGKGNRTFGSEQTVFDTTYGQYPLSNTAVLRANNSDLKPDFFFEQNSSTGTPPTQDYYMMVNTSSGYFARCNAPNSPTGFRICSPTSGATVSSPVRFSFAASWQVPIRKTELWIDGVKTVQLFGVAFSDYGFLDSAAALSKGTHSITIDTAGWDNSIQSKKYTITVK